MEQAGYEDGFSVALKTPRLSGVSFINDIARIIQTNLAEINIEVTIDEVELGSYITGTLLPGNFDMTFFPNLPYDEPDRPLAFYHSRGVTGQGNWTGYNNQDLDALIDAQSKEFEEASRQEIVLEAQRLILEEHGPQLTLSGGFAYSAHWNYVHYPYELGEDPPEDLATFGAEIWTERGG
jgi:peptide/nickel transport system substrate-binding protein